MKPNNEIYFTVAGGENKKDNVYGLGALSKRFTTSTGSGRVLWMQGVPWHPQNFEIFFTIDILIFFIIDISILILFCYKY